VNHRPHIKNNCNVELGTEKHYKGWNLVKATDRNNDLFLVKVYAS
jgi:hypothetical protein